MGRACEGIAKPVCYVLNLICTLLFEGSEEMRSLKEKCTGAGGDGSVMLCKFYGDVSEVKHSPTVRDPPVPHPAVLIFKEFGPRRETNGVNHSHFHCGLRLKMNF